MYFIYMHIHINETLKGYKLDVNVSSELWSLNCKILKEIYFFKFFCALQIFSFVTYYFYSQEKKCVSVSGLFALVKQEADPTSKCRAGISSF